MSKINELNIGAFFKHKGKIWKLVDKAHVKPGKGGAYIQASLKSICGIKLEERFSSDENVDRLIISKLEYQFSYIDGDVIFLIDNETFETKEINVSDTNAENFALIRAFADEDTILTLEYADDLIINISLPESMVVEVEFADPVVKGQTAASSFKHGVLKNGIKLLIPPYVESGHKIKVNPYGDKGVTFISRV
jgi:elongation factor P